MLFVHFFAATMQYITTKALFTPSVCNYSFKHNTEEDDIVTWLQVPALPQDKSPTPKHTSPQGMSPTYPSVIAHTSPDIALTGLL